MIEITTGMVFLLSSLYGAGHANANVANVTDAINNFSDATSSITTSTIISTSTEDYVRQAYADTPILIEVARCESQFKQFSKSGMVVRGIVNSLDVGVMQINEHYHAETALNKGINIYTTEGNVAFGKYLYEKYGTSPWSASSKCWNKELARK